jgi:hypothetical protein
MNGTRGEIVIDKPHQRQIVEGTLHETVHQPSNMLEDLHDQCTSTQPHETADADVDD